MQTCFDRGVCSWDAELHGVDVFHGRGAWSKGIPDQRAGAYESALGVLSDCDIEVIARGADLASFQKRYDSTDPYRWEFSNLLERLNERLKARREFGLVIADEHHNKELLQDDVARAKRYGTGGYRDQRLDRILDTTHFVDSTKSRMTQLADLVTFVLRRRESIRRETDPRAEVVMHRLYALAHDAVPQPTGKYFTVRR